MVEAGRSTSQCQGLLCSHDKTTDEGTDTQINEQRTGPRRCAPLVLVKGAKANHWENGALSNKRPGHWDIHGQKINLNLNLESCIKTWTMDINTNIKL